MGPMALFTHLKIILLQCFQFLVLAKISYIQTDPKTQFVGITSYKVGSSFFATFLLAPKEKKKKKK